LVAAEGSRAPRTALFKALKLEAREFGGKPGFSLLSHGGTDAFMPIAGPKQDLQGRGRYRIERDQFCSCPAFMRDFIEWEAYKDQTQGTNNRPDPI
jgi:hypothetical protein